MFFLYVNFQRSQKHHCMNSLDTRFSRNVLEAVQKQAARVLNISEYVTLTVKIARVSSSIWLYLQVGQSLWELVISAKSNLYR